MIQLTLTLKTTTAQVVETSVTVNNSPIQDYVHPDDQTQPTFEITDSSRFKLSLEKNKLVSSSKLCTERCTVGLVSRSHKAKIKEDLESSLRVYRRKYFHS